MPTKKKKSKSKPKAPKKTRVVLARRGQSDLVTENNTLRAQNAELRAQALTMARDVKSFGDRLTALEKTAVAIAARVGVEANVVGEPSFITDENPERDVTHASPAIIPTPPPHFNVDPATVVIPGSEKIALGDGSETPEPDDEDGDDDDAPEPDDGDEDEEPPEAVTAGAGAQPPAAPPPTENPMIDSDSDQEMPF